MTIRDWLERRASADVSLPGLHAEGFADYAPETAGWTPSVSWSSDLADWSANDTSLAADWVYRRQPAVRICVGFLAEQESQLRIKARIDGGETQSPAGNDHPLQQTLDRPNPRMSGNDLRRATVSDLALYENAYWLKRPASDALRVYRLPPSYVTVKGGDILTGPDGYELDMRNGRDPVPFTPEEIVHFHGYDPLDTRIGLSRLHALRAILREEIEASRWRAKFWKKGARMQGMLERPESAAKWSTAAKDNFREGWRRFIRGGDLEEETPILEDGMKYSPIMFSPKDAEFIAGREWALDMVATAYNIPLSLLSRTETTTYASMKEFHTILYTDVLGPWNALIEQTIDLQLVPDFGDPRLFVEFNIDEKMQGDFEQQANAARQSVQVPWLSVNEMRKLRGLQPIDDPAFDQPARPANYGYDGQQTPLQVVPGQAAAYSDRELAALLEER